VLRTDPLDVVLLLGGELRHGLVRHLLEVVETLLCTEVTHVRTVDLPLRNGFFTLLLGLLEVAVALFQDVLPRVLVNVGFLGKKLRFDDLIDETLELKRTCRLSHVLVADLHDLLFVPARPHFVPSSLIAPPVPILLVAVLGIL
jgi:hypothetical protein